MALSNNCHIFVISNVDRQIIHFRPCVFFTAFYVLLLKVKQQVIVLLRNDTFSGKNDDSHFWAEVMKPGTECSRESQEEERERWSYKYGLIQNGKRCRRPSGASRGCWFYWTDTTKMESHQKLQRATKFLTKIYFTIRASLFLGLSFEAGKYSLPWFFQRSRVFQVVWPDWAIF